MTMKLYYVTTGMGACLREAESDVEARATVLREVGTNWGVRSVREATETDIAWVKSMGGYFPNCYAEK